MKIVYLTTARHPEDYRAFLNANKNAPNPSNQNFHTKLINVLRKNYKLTVLSSRPMGKKIFLREKRNDIYLYPRLFNVPYIRRLSLTTSGLRIIGKENPDIIFVDALNVSLLILARRAKLLFNTKIIGVVTDNPMNITGTKKQYAQDIFKYSAFCDGFICLTTGLERLFNSANKPYVIIPGFITEGDINNEKDEEYAFFAGALYERYGVLSLIEAFKHKDAPLKLVIAGHGPLRETLLRKPHPNIEFLGHITPEISFLLAKKAKININPRPADEQIDLYSVPSKVIDFINSGTVTISTENREIRKLVADTIYWIPNNEAQTIVQALKTINKDYEFYKIRAASARKALLSNLSPEKTLKTIENLIKEV